MTTKISFNLGSKALSEMMIELKNKTLDLSSLKILHRLFFYPSYATA